MIEATSDYPKVNVDILILRNNKVLLGLLSERWSIDGIRGYGVPGRDLFFREPISDCVARNIKEELDCEVFRQRIICVNANYALGNHYIGIGIQASISGEPKLMKPEDWEKWEWFDLSSVPSNLFDPANYLIQCYLQNKINISD